MMKTTVKNIFVHKNRVTAFQNKILSWFETSGRHHFPWRDKELSNYEIVIAEVLLQRTKAETIAKFYQKFLLTFSSWKAIADSETVVLENHLRPVGLFRQRAKRLKDLATEMVKLNGIFPAKRENLEQIPFLGQYMVNAIELQVFEKPRPLLDVNMARVLERHFGQRKLSDIRYDPYLQKLAGSIVDHPKSKEINWAVLDFAAIVCKARKPICEKCLLSTTCVFRKNMVN